MRGVLRLAFGLGLLCCALANSQSCITASQVTLSGTLRQANGLPVSNSVITLTPSQQGYIAGCGVNVPLATTCGTSTDGSVIQTANPLTTTINTASGSGSLPSGTYYTQYAWYDALGHVTLPSPETRSILSATGSLVINPPTSGILSTAAGMDVYIGTTSGGETLQGQTSGSASYVQSATLITGASPATSNNTTCVVTANDAVWPTGTGYKVSMTDTDGNGIPGYPMQWQLMGAGSTINLSNGLPYYHGVVTYPAPILAQPQNHGTQSITGPLSLGGYNLLNVGKIGVGTSTPTYPIDVEDGDINTNSGYLVNRSSGSAGQALCSDGTALDSFCSYITSLPTIYYQIDQANGTPVAQAAANNFLSPLTVSSASGTTNIGINTTGSESKVVTAAAAGTSGNCVNWDASGGIVDSGAPCSSATPPFTGLSGYQTLPTGLMFQWGHSGPIADGSPGTDVCFPVAFPHAVFSANVTDDLAVGATSDVSITALITGTCGTNKGMHVWGTRTGNSVYWIAIGY